MRRSFYYFMIMIYLQVNKTVYLKPNTQIKRSDDYFYDEALTDEEILKRKNEKKNNLESTKATIQSEDPAWFKENNKPVEDPMVKFFSITCYS